MRCATAVVLALLVLLFPTKAAAEPSPMYLVDSANNLMTIDPGTGEVGLVGGTAAQFTDIAFGPDGRLFGVTPRYLYEIDPDDAWSTLLGNHGYGEPGASSGIDSLAFGADGTLYAAGHDIVITIDTETGQGTTVGTLSGYRSAGDLVLDDAGRLLSSSDSGHLLEVHTDGSGATLIGSLPYDDVFAMGRADDGSLYGVRSTNEIVTINPATGQALITAELQPDFLIGYAWGGDFPPTTPEPSTLVLCVSGLLVLVARRR